MYSLLAIILQFLSGSIMYSYLIAKLLGINLCLIGDRNPGLTNLWRAKGIKFGIIGLLLDYFKGIFPLILFITNDIIHDELLISIIAFFGILGHAFSPILRFKGGKAIATSFGAWTVLTKWEALTILGITFLLFTFLKPKDLKRQDNYITVLLGFLILLPYILYKFYIGHVHLILFYMGNMGVISYKYWYDWIKYFKKRNS